VSVEMSQYSHQVRELTRDLGRRQLACGKSSPPLPTPSASGLPFQVEWQSALSSQASVVAIPAPDRTGGESL
jgi:hypothetical protein